MIRDAVKKKIVIRGSLTPPKTIVSSNADQMIIAQHQRDNL